MAESPTPPLIPVEVIPPGSRSAPRAETPPDARPLTPFHPAAAALLIFFDNLWNFEEWFILTWIFTVPLAFISVFIPTLILQRMSRRDPWLTAFGKAFFLGMVAAIPTSLTGTPVGMALLAWAGIERLRK